PGAAPDARDPARPSDRGALGRHAGPGRARPRARQATERPPARRAGRRPRSAGPARLSRRADDGGRRPRGDRVVVEPSARRPRADRSHEREGGVMTWLLWRQNRSYFAAAGVVLAALAIAVIATGLRMQPVDRDTPYSALIAIFNISVAVPLVLGVLYGAA